LFEEKFNKVKSEYFKHGLNDLKKRENLLYLDNSEGDPLLNNGGY
jgi:hypothetical protein